MAANCSVSGCQAVVRARGLCTKHYQRWQRHGDTNLHYNQSRRTNPTPREQEIIDLYLRKKGASCIDVGRLLGLSHARVAEVLNLWGIPQRYTAGGHKGDTWKAYRPPVRVVQDPSRPTTISLNEVARRLAARVPSP